MSRQRQLKRCTILEVKAKELRRPQEWAEQRRREEIDNLLKLFDIFPEDRHEELMAFVWSEQWPNSGLAEMLIWIERGFWQPVALPPEVADIFLTDPLARPKARCATCNVFLPLRYGIWTNTATGQSWQAPLRYFRHCPCGGIIHQACGGLLEEHSWIPLRIVPPWSFQPDGD